MATITPREEPEDSHLASLRGALAGDDVQEEDDEDARLEQLRLALLKSSLSASGPAAPAAQPSPISKPAPPRPSLSREASAPRRSLPRMEPRPLSSRSMRSKPALFEDVDTSGSDSPRENNRATNVTISTGTFKTQSSAVFERLYAFHKQKIVNLHERASLYQQPFHPRINKNSERIVNETGRVSLYERALEQRFRHESALEMQQRQEREDRNRAKTLQTSQQLAWRRLRREIEQLFQARLPRSSTEPDQVVALDFEAFQDALPALNFQSITETLWEMLESNGVIHLNTFCTFIKQINFPASEDDVLKDEFSQKVRELLVGRKAVSTTSLAIEKVYREVVAETPFVPVITEKSRKLDEQRYARLGIDPKLPRSEKIHAELKILAERKEIDKMERSRRDLEECTFKPRTNTLVSLVSHDSGSSDRVRKDAGTRLYLDSLDRQQKLQQKKAVLTSSRLSEEIAECTFQPKINNPRRLPTQLPPSRVQETEFRARAFEQSVNRLKAWREKHVIQEDPLDLKNQARKQRGELVDSPSTTARQPRRSVDPSFVRHRPVLFTADVSLASGKVVSIEVKEGDDLVRLAQAFAKRNGLDKIEESVLLRNLREQQLDSSTVTYIADEDLLSDAEEDEQNGSSSEQATEEQDQDDANFIVIDVVVRPGEVYELRLAPEDDITQVAFDFAADVGMDEEARDELIHALLQVKDEDPNSSDVIIDEE